MNKILCVPCTRVSAFINTTGNDRLSETTPQSSGGPSFSICLKMKFCIGWSVIDF